MGKFIIIVFVILQAMIYDSAFAAQKIKLGTSPTTSIAGGLANFLEMQAQRDAEQRAYEWERQKILYQQELQRQQIFYQQELQRQQAEAYQANLMRNFVFSLYYCTWDFEQAFLIICNFNQAKEVDLSTMYL